MTHTFTDKDNLFTFTVKAEFLEKCPNPELCDLEELVTKHDYKSFLHNPTGVAVLYLEKIPVDVREALLKNEAIVKNEQGLPTAYWLNGSILSGEELTKFKHDIEFGDKFDKMLSSK